MGRILVKSKEPVKQGVGRGSPIVDFGVGVGTAIGKGGLGLGKAVSKVLGQATTGEGGEENKVSKFLKEKVPEGIDKIQKAIFEDPYEKNLSSFGGKAGNATGVVAEFMAGTPAITKAQSIMRGATEALDKYGKVAGFAGRTLSRAAPEAVGSGLTEYAISGGDKDSALGVAKLGGITSGIFGAFGDAYKAAFSPELEQSVLKGLGMTGKTSGGKTLGKAQDYIEGLTSMKERAPGIIVKDIHGVEKPFNPAKADYSETLQAWNETRKQVYSEYSALAKQASEEGATVDLTDTFTTLSQMAREPRTTAYKNSAKKILQELSDNFGVYDDAGELVGLKGTPDQLETYLADLNKQAATSITTGTGDRALGEISAHTSKAIREKMDDLITNLTGEEYQALRNEYASLKDIEVALVNQFKKAARRTGGGLTDYLQILNSGDLISGLVNGSPAWAASGAAKGLLAAFRKALVDPERYLRRSFDLIGKESTVGNTERIFGTGAKNADFQLGKKLIDDIKKTPGKQGGYINPKEMMDSLKKKLPDVDPAIIENEVAPGVQALEENGIDPTKFIESYFKKGSIPKIENSLISEAKKYKSAEEFVKAQPKLYHGGSADIKDIQLGKSNFQKTFYMSENPDYAKSFGGNKSSLNEIMVDSKAKLADLRKPSDDLVKQIEDIISSKPTGKTVRIQKPDGTFLEIPETKGGLSNPVHSSKDILNGIRQGKAYFAEMPEVKNALKKLGYDGMITQESKMGTNFGVWNKDILKTKSQLTNIWNEANKK